MEHIVDTKCPVMAHIASDSSNIGICVLNCINGEARFALRQIPAQLGQAIGKKGRVEIPPGIYFLPGYQLSSEVWTTLA